MYLNNSKIIIRVKWNTRRANDDPLRLKTSRFHLRYPYTKLREKSNASDI